MDKSKKIVFQQGHSVAFFIHRARVQRLYRNFLRVCDTKAERLQVREEFKTNKMGSAATLKEAEAILKRLQLARGAHNKQHDLHHHKPLASTSTVATNENEPSEDEPIKVEWPWQRTSNM